VTPSNGRNSGRLAKEINADLPSDIDLSSDQLSAKEKLITSDSPCRDHIPT
jgi:hypothetical protein